MARRKYQRTKEEVESGRVFCPQCQKVKPLASYGKDKSRPHGVQQYCLPCRRANKNRWRNKRRAEGRGREPFPNRRNAHLKSTYGITEAEYLKLSEEQGHVCAICGNPEPGKKSLAVDHDHSTGTLRGLLCGNCNTGIGLLKDSSAVLEKAVRYLKANGC